MTSGQFVPRYPQPCSTETLLELPYTTLSDEVVRLDDSIARLIASNVEMVDTQADPECDEETRDILRQAHEENLVTIETQRERVEMIKWTIQRKLQRSTDIAHYNVSPQTQPIQPIVSSATQAAHRPRLPSAESESQDLADTGAGITL